MEALIGIMLGTGISSYTRIIYKSYVTGGMLSAVEGLPMINHANAARADYGNSYAMQTIIYHGISGLFVCLFTLCSAWTIIL